MDTLKRGYLGCYGSEWVKTPSLDRFAAEAVVFDQAYCASFPCMPARRDFVTGNYEFPFRGWGPLEETDRPVAARLSAAGQTTALVTDHYHLFREGSGNYHWPYDCWQFIRGIEADKVYSDPAAELGIDYRCRPERLQAYHREHYYKFKHFEMKTEADWFAPRTYTAASDWVRRNRRQPGGFHLQIDCFPPHEPFDPPPGYAEAYDPDYVGDRLATPAYRPWDGNYTEREIRNIRALYAGLVTHVDKWFGAFIDSLREMGVLEQTLVVVSTDHGTYTGDHGWTGKLGTYMYDCVCHIPLMIRCPGVKPRRETALAQNVDVVPTLLEAAGTTPEVPIHGRSLLPLVRGEAERVREYAHSGMFGRWHTVNDGRYAFHQWHSREAPLHWYGLTNTYFVGAGPLGPVETSPLGPRRLVAASEPSQRWPTAIFDLQADPNQEHNLAPERPDLVARFKAEIERFCAEISAPPEYLARLFG